MFVCLQCVFGAFLKTLCIIDEVCIGLRVVLKVMFMCVMLQIFVFCMAVVLFLFFCSV